MCRNCVYKTCVCFVCIFLETFPRLSIWQRLRRRFIYIQILLFSGFPRSSVDFLSKLYRSKNFPFLEARSKLNQKSGLFSVPVFSIDFAISRASLGLKYQNARHIVFIPSRLLIACSGWFLACSSPVRFENLRFRSP